MRLVCQRSPCVPRPICLQDSNDRRRPRPHTVRDWFGDPARAGSAAGRGGAPPRRRRPRSRGRRHPAGRGRRRGAARRFGRRFRPAPRARRGVARRRTRSIRSPWRHHLFAEGLRPAHDPLPGPLPLLRLRRHSGAAAEAPQAGVHVARSRCSPSCGRDRRSAARRRSSRSAIAPRIAGPRPGRGSTSTASPRPSTTSAHIARLITAETGMLAHLNPGVMTAAEMRMLRPTAPSMGMMLETTSRALFEEPGQVHYGSPDKDPAVRLAVIEDAGRERVPFTTGILVGIGETSARSGRVARRPARGPRTAWARAGGDRPELPREAEDRDAGGAGCGAPRIRRRGRRRAARDGLADADPGAAEPLRSCRVRPARACRCRRLGRGVAAHGGPRQPGAPVAASRRPRGAHRGPRLRAARASHGASGVRP